MNDGLIIDLYFERNETAFFAYLAKIIRNLSFNMYKKNRTQKRNAVIVELSSEMEQCIPAPDDLKCKLSQEEFSNMMNGFLYGLKEIHCIIFLLRYWYCESISNIAKRLRISEGTVKSILSRTRSKLKQYLDREGYDL